MSGALALRLRVSGQLVGGIIGRGGETIHHIQSSCQVHISTGQKRDRGGEPAPFQEYRDVSVTGPLAGIVKAICIISDRLLEKSNQSFKELVFLVPEAHRGKIIGKGGDHLRRIEGSGCKVTINREAVNITGEQQTFNTATLVGQDLDYPIKMMCEYISYADDSFAGRPAIEPQGRGPPPPPPARRRDPYPPERDGPKRRSDGGGYGPDRYGGGGGYRESRGDPYRRAPDYPPPRQYREPPPPRPYQPEPRFERGPPPPRRGGPPDRRSVWANDPTKATVRIGIPNVNVGVVMGDRGDMISALQKKNKTHINVSKKSLGNNLRLTKISGKPDSVAETCVEIAALIHGDTGKNDDVEKDPEETKCLTFLFPPSQCRFTDAVAFGGKDVTVKREIVDIFEGSREAFILEGNDIDDAIRLTCRFAVYLSELE